MISNFLTSVSDISMPTALLVAVIGMVVVFLVLAILILILMGFEHVFELKWLRDDYVRPSKNKKGQNENEQIVVENEEDDAEVVAAISAALMCMYGSQKQEDTAVAPFRIRNIKRIK